MMSSPKKILIVEDEAIIGMALTADLEDLGYEVIDVCPTGEEALSTIQQQQVDIVILDVKLGNGMDGLETLQEIRKIANPKVVVISGNSEVHTQLRIKEIGANGFLVKPVNLTELQHVLQNLTGSSGAA